MLTPDDNEAPKQRRRGRPKGSRNRKGKRQRTRRDVNEEFAAAFQMREESNDRKTEASEEVIEDDGGHFGEEADFETNLMNSRFDDDDDEIIDKEVDDDVTKVEDVNEEVVGFGCADEFDVCELLELARETEESEMNTIKTMKQELKEIQDGCVGKNSSTAYLSSICDLLFYTFENDRHILHNYWIKAIKSFSYGISNKKKGGSNQENFQEDVKDSK